MKLELKHLYSYLPYGLKFKDIPKGYDESRLLSILNLEWCLSQGKPILRPISDLYKEIEHNGKKVIMLWDGEDEENDNFLIEDLDCPTQIDFEGHTTYCIDLMDYGDVTTLLEYHFDVFGLIDKGLAIDINTIK